MVSRSLRRQIGLLLLICLGLQPFNLLAFDWESAKANNAPKAVQHVASRVGYDTKISGAFNSPRVKDTLLFNEASTYKIKRDKHIIPLMSNKKTLPFDDFAKHFPGAELKERRAWIKLLDTLQFTNEAGKKSIMGSIGHTIITEAGAVAFLNLLGQENRDWNATKRRQALIKFLVENPQELVALQTKLKTIKAFEPAFLKELFKKPEEKSLLSFQNVLIALGYGLANFLAYYNDTINNYVENRPNDVAWKSIAKLHVALAAIYGINMAIEKNDKLNGPWKNGKNVLTALASAGLTLEGAGLMFAPGETLAANLLPFEWLLKTSFFQNTVKNKLDGMHQDGATKFADCTQPASWKKTAYAWKNGGIQRTPGAPDMPTGIPFVLSALLQQIGTTDHADVKNWLKGKFPDDDSWPPYIAKKGGMGMLLGGLLLGFSLLDKHARGKQEFARAQAIAQVVRSSDEIFNMLQNQPAGNGYSPLFKGFSQDGLDLIAKSYSSTVDMKASYHPGSLFVTNHAHIENILKLSTTTFEDMSQLTQFYGELDAYAAMAQLMLDHQNTKNSHGEGIHLCFAQMDETSTEAYAHAEDMWHPMIATDRVRTNSIKLGGAPETPRNGIITGPNAAGKSVSMKSLLVSIIFAQTFGVGFAKSLVFTPFKKIIANFGSADDTANDQSKFMFEATCVVELLKELQTLPADWKAFVFTDELFSGTEVTPAILLSVELCSRVSVLKNVCYILATHYKDLTKLKELTGNNFENYKVTATVDDDSHVSYPFKLMHGVGDTNVAFDIFLDQMRKQGVNDPELVSIIKNAKDRQKHGIATA